jgi:signal transduction histidine kinase
MQAPRTTLLGVAAVGIAMIATATWLPLNSTYLPPADNPTTIAVFALLGLAWLLAAEVTLVRQPGNPLWKLILAYLVMSWFVWALQFVPDRVVQGLAITFHPMDIAVFVHVLVAFPSGHLRTRFDRRLVLTVYALVVGIYLLWAALWEPAASCPTAWCPENVLLIWPQNELAGEVTRAGQLAAPIVGLFVLYAIWRHWRAAAPAARRTLLPVVLAVPIAYLYRTLGYLSDALQIDLLSFLEPRYHAVAVVLYNIVPVGLLLGLLRLRLDRGRVAGLLVELGRGVPAGGLRDVLARALGDPTLQLAFAAPSGAGFIDGAGHPVDVGTERPDRALAPIERDGEALAVLVHDRTIDDENPGLVEAVGSAARLAIENEHLTAQVRAQLEEVRASRARIVDAADAERRRVERDLHDGAQQRLLALAMRLQLARDASGNAGALLDEATAELHAAIAEVRDLARGIHPPILAEAGLAAALETLAERSPVPVRVQATDARYRPAVETTAFYVVAEALTNAARHAGATEVVVRVSSDGRRLTVTVSDDGRGGADPSGGSGLRGLADRVAAIGGRLSVTSQPGEGTTVAAELPLA